jgi:transcriptional regulator with XRE-family HTH domain
MSRYETGTHEPPFSLAEKLAAALHVPVAYLYCDDDQIAALIVDFSMLDSAAKERVQALVDDLRSI